MSAYPFNPSEEENVTIKQLTQSGNSKALVLEKTLLQAAGIDENTLFQIVINPKGGMTIQSVQSNDKNFVESTFNRIMKNNHELLKRLADK